MVGCPNACAAGVAAAEIAETLIQFSKYAVPEHVLIEIRDYASRYGRLNLLRDPRGLVLEANDEFLAEQISRNKHVSRRIPGEGRDGKACDCRRADSARTACFPRHPVSAAGECG
jgi:hypothetical protein